MWYRTLLVALFLTALSNCSGSVNANQGLVTRLNNRGPVPLSTDNPYIAANLLVAKEMEQSPDLRGFIQHRGAPNAIEVAQDYFAPLRMTLYYADSREYYTAEEVEHSWVLSGPFPIDRATLSSVSTLSQKQAGKPILLKPDAKKGVNPPPPADQDDDTTPVGSISDEAFHSPAPSAPKPSMPISQPESRNEEDDMAIKIERFLTAKRPGQAETSPRGDIVHYVTDPRENLLIVAQWYTYDDSNAARLARINNLPDKGKLSIGDTIVIPSYLVKNKSRLSKEALAFMLANK